MGKISKFIRYYYTSIGKGNCNAMHDKSLYEGEYTDGVTEKLVANIIAENMLSQVESEVHHYQVLNEVTYIPILILRTAAESALF